jgi:ATP-dependent Clp protease, protease subunit
MHSKKNTTYKTNEGLSELFKGTDSDSYSSDYGKFYEYYLSDEIGDSSEYSSWFQEIRNTRPSDVIKIHINSPGGNLFTAIQFLQALAETEAHVIASVEGMCMSAATMIFLAADEFQISPHSMFMFHNYSGGSFGKGGEMYDNVMHERKWSEKLLTDMYLGFLTKGEIDSLLGNKDIWMDCNEVVVRLKKREAIRKKQELADSKKKNSQPIDGEE